MANAVTNRMTNTMTSKSTLLRWLFLVISLTASMVVIGGVTRLTDSGLSIVDWRPIMGAIPPFTESQWLEVFFKYQTSPEFIQVNNQMTLEGFKQIYFWEYIHRLTGRLIGLVFFFPLLFFTIRRSVKSKVLIRCWIGFAMGGSQGLLGWYMVKSGLVNDPRVSHIRLASHLMLAFTIIAYLLWLYLDLYRGKKEKIRANPENSGQLIRFGFALFFAMYFVQIAYGAFVAKLRAGHIYNTFPKMGTNWVPEEAFIMDPLWFDLLENAVSIQLIHRLLAWCLVVLGAGLGGLLLTRISLQPFQKRAVHLFFGALVLQFALGVTTLVLHVPIVIASIHQFGALVLLISAVNLVHGLSMDKIEFMAERTLRQIPQS